MHRNLLVPKEEDFAQSFSLVLDKEDIILRGSSTKKFVLGLGFRV